MADWFRDAFDNIERIDFLIDGFPFGIFEGKIPNIPELEGSQHETAALISYSHMVERFVEEPSICIRDVAMFLFSKELFLASLDIWNNGIEVVVRVPEQHPDENVSG